MLFIWYYMSHEFSASGSSAAVPLSKSHMSRETSVPIRKLGVPAIRQTFNICEQGSLNAQSIAKNFNEHIKYTILSAQHCRTINFSKLHVF